MCFVVVPPKVGVQITGSSNIVFVASGQQVVFVSSLKGSSTFPQTVAGFANVRHPDAIVEMSVLTSVFVGRARGSLVLALQQLIFTNAPSCCKHMYCRRLPKCNLCSL